MADDKPTEEKDNKPKDIEKTELPVIEKAKEFINKQEETKEQTQSIELPKEKDAEPINKWWKDIHFYSMLANIVMAVATIIAVYIASVSLNTSNEALKLTRESIKGSGAKDSAIIEIMRSTSEATRINAEASLRNVSVNEQYIQIFENAAQKENRAFITVGQMEPIVFRPGESFQYSIAVKNIGKTPAYKVRMRGINVSHSSDKAMDVDVEFWKYLDSVRYETTQITLGYGDSVPFYQFKKNITSQALYDAFGRGEMAKYAAINIIYDDIFGKHHYTHGFWKYRFNGTIDLVTPYKTYNDAE